MIEALSTEHQSRGTQKPREIGGCFPASALTLYSLTPEANVFFPKIHADVKNGLSLLLGTHRV